jgi:hypothetical protein
MAFEGAADKVAVFSPSAVIVHPPTQPAKPSGSPFWFLFALLAVWFRMALFACMVLFACMALFALLLSNMSNLQLHGFRGEM